MKLREHQAKSVFARYGIAIPRGEVVDSPEKAESATRRLASEVVIKPQLGVKGRGKVGGIRFAGTPDAAFAEAADLLGSDVKGEVVKSLLVEERIVLQREFYLAVTVDYSARRPVLIASSSGGVDIEDAARTNPGSILRSGASMLHAPGPEQLDPVSELLGEPAAEMLGQLYRIFLDFDAEMVEINPVAETEGGLIALDAVLNVNDAALYRHDELSDFGREIEVGDPFAEEARKKSWTYIDLEGDIGILSSGAGLTMTILDLIAHQGGSAANFLDTAQIDAEGMYEAFDFMKRASTSRVLLVNIFAGLNRCDDLAAGILNYLRDHGQTQPVVVRMVGSFEKEGHQLLRSAGIEPLSDLEEAVNRCVSLAASNGGAA